MLNVKYKKEGVIGGCKSERTHAFEKDALAKI